jgi:hypothetical protein
MSTAQRYADAEIFKKVYENYGHAMPIYIAYVVDNQVEIKRQLAGVERKLIEQLGMASEERYWRALLTVCITGALLAKKLGIIDHDVNALLPAALKHYAYQRAALSTSSGTGTLHQFVQDNQSAVLVVDVSAPTVTASGLKLVTVMRAPSAHVNVRMRYMLDTHELWVDRSFLRAYCSEKNMDFRTLITLAESEGWLVEDQVRKEMTSYTRISTPARAVCVVFDMAKAGTLIDLIQGQ